jgi:predicted metalloprotease with PDZ domain
VFHATVLLAISFLLIASSTLSTKPDSAMAFVVSMEQPNTHLYHVVFRCAGLKGETQDFKMPVWTPGYYVIMDYPKNVVNFRAEDGAGHALAWEKTAKNVWRVKSRGATSMTVIYDVYAFNLFCAESCLDDSQGFITPASVFMYLAGRINHPVIVTIKPYKDWCKVSTGLDPVEGRPNTFFASDFDVLYDSPILVGNQEVLAFNVRGIPLEFVGADLGAIDRAKLASDLGRIVEAAANLIGEIPYRRYVFISIGPGGGGLEHQNSTALAFDPAALDSAAGYRNFLSFVCHEYFHLYNVKRIRPLALGPFDYDREDYTDMLWVSEGITVYYEDLLLKRAGLLTRDQVLDHFRTNIARYENIPGHLFQSATEASFDTWIDGYARAGNAANTTISYYDKGAALGMLLDLAIRHESKNAKSLDDAMRTLYRTYYKEKKRGFTDEEFRQACERAAGGAAAGATQVAVGAGRSTTAESAAGGSLAEVFEYASTVKDIDYAKYLGYAGLAIDVGLRDSVGVYLGANTAEREGRLTITGVEWESPAARAGLSEQDEIIALDDVRVGSAGAVDGAGRTMADLLKVKKPGDKVKVLVSRRGMVRELEVVLGKKPERSFAITPMPNPTPAQAAMLEGWLAQ